MIKKMKFVFAPLLLAAVLGACSDNEETAPKEDTAKATEEQASGQETKLDLPAEEDVVVVVNDEEVLGNVYNSVARQLETSMATQGTDVAEEENAKTVKDQAVNVIVGNKLILQDAAAKGHKTDDAVVKERLEEIKGQFESEDAMNEALEQSGYSMADIEQQLSEQITYEAYVAKELKTEEITDEELAAAYDQFKSTSEEEAPPFEEMEPMIRQSLEQEKSQEAVSKRIEELKKDAEIDVKI
ncbi:MAG TPA: SurA N-terminal domain-containing protein [Planococcus sp. (in: firmicutes)]|nr:SurA N-terminal domain-containing protein [Planococcus sp. (in: firmicutes)]